MAFLEDFVQGTFSGSRTSHVDRPRGDLVVRGWRNLYTKRHNVVAEKARSMVRCVVESLRVSQSVEIELYEKILAELKSLELSFVDVKMLLFKPK